MQDKRFGVVRFEDVHQHNTGWASIEGGRPFRIRGTENLESNVIFITNLRRDLMYKSGFFSNGRFRSIEYFSINFCEEESDIQRAESDKINITWSNYNLMHLIGADPNKWHEHVQIMSALFRRIFSVGHTLLGVKSPPFYAYAYGLRELLPDDDIMDKKVAVALDDATTHYVKCETDASLFYQKKTHYIAIFPKVSHAQALLTETLLPKPNAEWKPFAKKDIPKNQEDIRGFVHGAPYLFIARINILEIHPGVNRIINFGTGSAYRTWVTSIELSWLIEVCEIQIYDVLYCTEAETPRVISEVFNRISDQVGNLALSISTGLVLENFWLGLTRQAPPPVHRLKNKYSTNTMKPFIKSMDMMRCMDAALHLQMAGGIDILGYGKGKISFLSDRPLSFLLKACYDAGLLLINTNATQSDIDFLDFKTPEQVAFGMYAKRDKTMILEADTTIVENLENLLTD